MRDSLLLGEVLAPALQGLFADHGAAVAFHRGVVGRDQLRPHHALKLVLVSEFDTLPAEPNEM